jgi:hypothetical protein
MLDDQASNDQASDVRRDDRGVAGQGQYTVTAESTTAAPVTASMNLSLTGQGGQGNSRNMRRIVAETFGKRSDCSLENTIALCMLPTVDLAKHRRDDAVKLL